jgi:hypothetical protein
LTNNSFGSEVEKIDYSGSFSENISYVDSEKQKPNDFFDEVSIVFSSLGSLFGFLN